MRNAFLKKMLEKASENKKVMLLTGDLGFGVFEPFAEKYPKQFINVGIAEQSMVGIAAGLALNGYKVFVYSIGNFPTLRALEQWRNDICYHNLPVTVVINGGGFAYGYLGMSHHATEDISVLRALPGMTVAVPADPLEVERCFDYLYNISAPGYLRLCRGGEKLVHESLGAITDPVLLPIIANNDAQVCIVMTGEIASKAVEIDKNLRSANIVSDIYSCPLLKPSVDFSALQNKKYKLLVSIEENNVIGGLGSSWAEYLSSLSNHPRLLRIGIPDTYSCVVGNHDFLKMQNGLSVDKIVCKVKEYWQ